MKADRRGLIALDGDGVLFDYVMAYGGAWAKFLGREVFVADPNAYSPQQRWGVRWLEGADLIRFKSHFDSHFWSTIPALSGALEACRLLVENGCQIVCVTALDHEHRDARQLNLSSMGFPVSKVFTTPHSSDESPGQSPKVKTLELLKPLAFVDDYLPYMVGVPSSIHRALVMRESNGNPNDRHADLGCVDSTHSDLLAFARWWMSDDSTALSDSPV